MASTLWICFLWEMRIKWLPLMAHTHTSWSLFRWWIGPQMASRKFLIISIRWQWQESYRLWWQHEAPSRSWNIICRTYPQLFYINYLDFVLSLAHCCYPTKQNPCYLPEGLTVMYDACPNLFIVHTLYIISTLPGPLQCILFQWVGEITQADF